MNDINNIVLTPKEAAFFVNEYIRLAGFQLILTHGKISYEVKPTGSLPHQFREIRELCDRLKPICEKLTLALELLEEKAAAYV